MKDIHKRATKAIISKIKKNPDTPMHRFLFDLFLLALGIFILLAALALVWVSSLKLPSFNDFEARKVSNSTRIYDRTGTTLLYNFHANIRRTVVPFDNISPNIKHAVVAIEDDQFYNHHGIRITSIIRSVLKTASGNTQGGSTITQQVVKNALLTPDKTITRKIKEWILALKLEHNMTKDEILAVYLNESPFGGTIYGVQEASLAFFGKPASALTINEAAYMAALPQAPSRYSPYGKHVDELVARKNQVLLKMYQKKYITKEEYNNAKNVSLTFQAPAKSSGKALHFDFYVKEYLEDKYGEEMVENGGLKIISTLDWELQQKAETVVREYANKNAREVNAENAGLVAIDSRTGEILSMVGSRDYFDPAIDGKFNIAIAKRQPGSSFKPLVYAAAFEKGYTPETVLFDVPTEFNVNCPTVPSSASPESCYSPVNYDGKYRGPISLRGALAQSLNVPAVKLLYLTGVNTAIDTARKMGITTLGTKGQYGLTLVLGGGEVTLTELTSAYTTFASNGERPEKTAILSVTTNDGKVLEQFVPKKVPVFSRDTALRISSILSDNAARTPAFGANSPLHFGGRPVAVKTGTTNDYKDVWTVGYTPSITVGVWGGNNNNRPIAKKSAGAVISPMWRAFMDQYFALHPAVESFDAAPGSSDNPNPILRGVWCSPSSGVHSILYYINKNSPREYSPGQTSDSQWRMWEGGLRAMSSYACPFSDELGNVPGAPGIDTGSATSTDGGASSTEPFVEAPISFSVSGVPVGAVDPAQTITLSTISGGNVSTVEYTVSGTVVGAPSSSPYSVTFVPSEIGIGSGSHTISVRVYSGNAYSVKTIQLSVQ